MFLNWSFLLNILVFDVLPLFLKIDIENGLNHTVIHIHNCLWRQNRCGYMDWLKCQLPCQITHNYYRDTHMFSFPGGKDVISKSYLLISNWASTFLRITLFQLLNCLQQFRMQLIMSKSCQNGNAMISIYIIIGITLQLVTFQLILDGIFPIFNYIILLITGLIQ